MNELKRVIHKDSRDTTEKYIRWEYEDIAPMPTPREIKGIDNTQKDIDVFLSKKYGSKSYPEKKEYTPEEFSDEAKYTSVQYHNVEKQKNKIKEKLRTDLLSFSTIKIDRIDGKNDYTDVQLINADRFQKISDPTMWSVLTLYAGSGQGNQSVGIMVRKSSLSPKEDFNTSENSIEG